MKTALALVLFAAVSAAPALAQDSTARDDIEQSDGELSPAVQAYVTRGDEQSNRLRFDAASREYRRAADVARHEGHLPSWTSWKVATASYYAGDLTGAAATLDQLTDEAARVGDLGVEALSIYYAAWLNGKAGLKAEAAARVARLEDLLRSRYLPVAIRDRLSSLLTASKEVAVER